MKTVGMIGGIAPASTVEYYRLIVDGYHEQIGDGSYPRIIINSIDLRKLIDWFEAKQHNEVVEYIVAELETLGRAGVDFGFISSNTPHTLFDEISPRSPFPLISVIDEVCKVAKDQDLKRLGLFGTRFTVDSGMYPKAFAKEGMTVISPNDEELDYIHEKYMREFAEGVFLPATRARLVEIAREMKSREGVEALILGGTELPLILRDEDSPGAGLPFLDPVRIHANSIVARMLS
jgi:aspartate racemase